MSKNYKILLGILVFVLALLIFLEATAPDPVDWRKTYSIKDKIPYGTYIFHESLKTQTDQFFLAEESPYHHLKDSTFSGNYILIDEELYFGETTLNQMLKWVEKGNTLFVAAAYSDLFDLDTLQLRIRGKTRTKSLLNYPEYNFFNEKLKAENPYVFKRNSSISYFHKIDTLQHIALGNTALKEENNQPEINFIKIPFGNGEFLLHSSPSAFSNFFLLQKNNIEYAEKLLAYLDLEKENYYDVYHDRNYNISKYYTSPLYVILENKELKWGYYFLLLGGILFVIFEGKRKQKAIPILPPLQNNSYQYIRSIAGLYLDKKDHTAIAHKQIEQFLIFIREHLRVEIKKIDQELIDKLHNLTEISKEEIIALFKKIQELQSSSDITKKELLSLNKKINEFKNNI